MRGRCFLKCFVYAAHSSLSFRKSMESATGLMILDEAVGKGSMGEDDNPMDEITKGSSSRTSSALTISTVRAWMGLISSTNALIRACSQIKLMTRGIPFAY